MRKPKLVITRGLPGSGKTTFARKWVAEAPRTRARVNRDDTGVLLHGERFYHDRDLMQDTEKAITIAQHAAIGQLLQRGWDVICDDTNLPRRTARDLRAIAIRNGADFEIHDMLDVPLDVVYAQNAQRLGTQAFVPEDVIKRMAERHTGRNAYEIPLAPEESDAGFVEPYVPQPGTPDAIIVDIDGTVALMQGRSPFDETRVHEDHPNHAVIRAVRAMQAAGNKVIFCSGRTDGCFDATEVWIKQHVGVPYEALLMRKSGDQRKDNIIKLEIFDEHIRFNYNIVGVFDDRLQVVKAWRSIGLPVFAVAEGDF
jgi:predicted kinase